MNCAFDKEKLSGYYDAELDAAEKAEVERHIASCSECLRELGELKSAALLVKELPRLRAPRSIAEGVAREIQAVGKVHRFAKVRRNVLWAGAVAAGVFVILNVVYFARMERTAAETRLATVKSAPTIASVPAPAESPEPSAKKDPEALRRGALGERAEERERRLDEQKGASADAKKEAQPLGSVEPARKLKEEPARPLAEPEKPTAARSPESKPTAPPSAAAPPAPKPAPPSPAPLAGKDDARPFEPPTEKA